MMEVLRGFARDYPRRYAAVVLVCGCVALVGGGTSTVGNLGTGWFCLLVLIPNMTEVRDRSWRYCAALVAGTAAMGLAFGRWLNVSRVDLLLFVVGPVVIMGLVSWRDVHKSRTASA